MASEMISLCLRHELRVPENIAVLGGDNDDLINSGLMMGLSSVDSDQEGLGVEAANCLQGLLDEPENRTPLKYIATNPSAWWHGVAPIVLLCATP